jgi:hypothetical protein
MKESSILQYKYVIQLTTRYRIHPRSQCDRGLTQRVMKHEVTSFHTDIGIRMTRCRYRILGNNIKVIAADCFAPR